MTKIIEPGSNQVNRTHGPIVPIAERSAKHPASDDLEMHVQQGHQSDLRPYGNCEFSAEYLQVLKHQLPSIEDLFGVLFQHDLAPALSATFVQQYLTTIFLF